MLCQSVEKGAQQKLDQAEASQVTELCVLETSSRCRCMKYKFINLYKSYSSNNEADFAAGERLLTTCRCMWKVIRKVKLDSETEQSAHSGLLLRSNGLQR